MPVRGCESQKRVAPGFTHHGYFDKSDGNIVLPNSRQRIQESGVQDLSNEFAWNYTRFSHRFSQQSCCIPDILPFFLFLQHELGHYVIMKCKGNEEPQTNPLPYHRITSHTYKIDSSSFCIYNRNDHLSQRSGDDTHYETSMWCQIKDINCQKDSVKPTPD